MKKRFYVRSADDRQKTLGNVKFSDRELKVEVVERGIVLPAQKIPDTFTYKGGVCARIVRSSLIKRILPTKAGAIGRARRNLATT